MHDVRELTLNAGALPQQVSVIPSIESSQMNPTGPIESSCSHDPNIVTNSVPKSLCLLLLSNALPLPFGFL